MSRILWGAVLLASGCAASAGASAGVGVQARPSAYSSGYVQPAVRSGPSKRQGLTRQQDLQVDAFEAEQRARIRAHGDPERDRQRAIQDHNDRAIADMNAHAAHLAEIANDPRYAVPAISVIVCQLEGQSEEYREKLQREKRIEQTGGVVDLRANRELAEGIEENRSAVVAWKAHLKEKFSVAPVACSSMPTLAKCHADHEQCDHDSAEQDDLVRNGVEQLGH